MWDHPLTYIVILTAIGMLAGAAWGLIRIGRWTQAVDSDRTAFNSFMDKVDGKLDRIIAALGPAAVARGSPLKLTELGRAISESLDAETWAQDTLHILLDRAAEAEFSEAFEFHELANAYVTQEFNPSGDFLRRMRACAYENGVPLEQVQSVLIVVLRDALLAAEDNPQEG